MRNSLLTTALFSVMAINLAEGQESDLLALNKTGENNISSTRVLSNTIKPKDYISQVALGGVEKQTTKLQKKVVVLPLESLEEYNEKEPSRYHVVLKDKNAVAHIWYDSSGEVIKTMERYQNIELPSKIRRDIAFKYPGWSFGNNRLVVKYVRGKQADLGLRLQLTKGKTRKVVNYNF